MACLRPAHLSDLPFLVELRRLSMGPHRLAAGIHDTDADLESKVLEGFDVARIIHCEQKPIGLFKAHREGPTWALSQIQLLPAWQGRGIGTYLIAELVKEAALKGASVELSVLKASPARRLYERMGFRLVGEGDRGVRLRAGP